MITTCINEHYLQTQEHQQHTNEKPALNDDFQNMLDEELYKLKSVEYSTVKETV